MDEVGGEVLMPLYRCLKRAGQRLRRGPRPVRQPGWSRPGWRPPDAKSRGGRSINHSSPGAITGLSAKHEQAMAIRMRCGSAGLARRGLPRRSAPNGRALRSNQTRFTPRSRICTCSRPRSTWPKPRPPEGVRGQPRLHADAERLVEQPELWRNGYSADRVMAGASPARPAIS